MAGKKYQIHLSDIERRWLSQVVELGYVESICHEQVGKMLKKTKSSP